MKNLTKLKRKLIGGIWIKNKNESKYIYCVNSIYSGFASANIKVENLEDYGSVTLFGKLLGYLEHSPISQKKYISSYINLNEIFMCSVFFLSLYFLHL